MADILVTGATGFIGRALVPRRVANGQSVAILTRDKASAARAKALHPIASQLPLDDLDTDGSASRFGSIVHLAGRAHVLVRAAAMEGPAFHAANVELTEQLCSYATATNAPQFIFLSSIAAVTTNSATAPVTDDTPPAPDTAYGRSKLAAEAHIAGFAVDGRLGISLRPPLVIGADAGANWGALQRLASTRLPLPFGSVHNRRSLIDRNTLCAAIAHLAERDWPAELSGAYAIAQPAPVSLSQIVAALRQGMGQPAGLIATPPSLLRLAGQLTGRTRTIQSITGDLVVDPSRFLSTFDFAPDVSVLDAIAESGRAFKARREAPRP